MPTIAVFYGIIIQMYWRDHAPPHLHAIYQDYEGLVSIKSGEVIGGRLPAHAARIVRQWVLLRRAELMENCAWTPGPAIRAYPWSGRGRMIDIVKIIRVEKLGGFRLRLRFSDGSEGERDFSDIIAEGGPMVEPLRDSHFFDRVFLEMGTLAWPNGFDLDSIALHEEMKSAGQLYVPAARESPY